MLHLYPIRYTKWEIVYVERKIKEFSSSSATAAATAIDYDHQNFGSCHRNKGICKYTNVVIATLSMLLMLLLFSAENPLVRARVCVMFSEICCASMRKMDISAQRMCVTKCSFSYSSIHFTFHTLWNWNEYVHDPPHFLSSVHSACS